MLWKLSWKNIWRNKLRSIIVMVASTLGVFASIFMTAFMNGMVDERIKSVINTEISHIQIHQPDFRDNNDFSLIINNADSMLGKVDRTIHVMASSKRIIISSLIASAKTNTDVNISGIVPENEKKVTNLHNMIVSGNYFDSKGKNQVVIGMSLAEKLKVTINDSIAISVQDINKNIVNDKFTVVGIYETDNTLFDEANAFVPYNDICKLTGLKDSQAHEIAILLDNNKQSTSVAETLKTAFPSFEVLDWMELSPEAGSLVSMMNQYMYVFIVIILLALGFSLINTMLMVVLERMKEFGILMAVGMSKAKICIMIMLETIYLSLSGGVLGTVISYLLCKHLEKAGMNLYFWKEAFSSLGYSSIIYPSISFQMISITTGMIILTAILSALYPAYKALKCKPAEAVRTE